VPASAVVDTAAFSASGWQGELTVALGHRNGATVVERRIHRGPLQIQRGFYPEGPQCCHLYLLHPPGGLVAGDQLRVEVSASAGAAGLVTTPAATKVYRSLPGRRARQRQVLRVAGGAQLEWLPQETIVFDGAEAELATEIHLEPGAAFLGWEIVCLGRAAGDVPFRAGSCRQRIELFREGRPLFIDRTDIQAGGELAGAPYGLRGQPVLGTLVASPVPADLLDRLREADTGLHPEDLAAITAFPEVLVCRYLGADAGRARAHFVHLWRLLRPALLGRPPCPPRIWAT
jgi:urease accessory protein